MSAPLFRFARVAARTVACNMPPFEIPADAPRVLSFAAEERLMPVTVDAEPFFSSFVALRRDALDAGAQDKVASVTMNRFFRLP